MATSSTGTDDQTTISLIGFCLLCIKRWKTVVSIFVAGVVCASAYINVIPERYELAIDVSPVNEARYFELKQLTPYLSKLGLTGEDIPDQRISRQISADASSKFFFNLFRKKDVIRSIVSRRMHDREYEDLSLEQQAEVSMKVDQFTIRVNESLPNNLLMIVNTKNIPESLEIVREITHEINRSLQTRNKSAIDAFVDSAKAKKNLDVRNAQTRIDALSQNFLRIHSMRLARLEEMARIARSLNIEEALQSDSEVASRVEPITQLLPSRFGTNDDWALPTYYLRGFKAIEEEINVIKARDLAKPYLYDTQILDIINKREVHAADTSTSMLAAEAKSLKILAEGEELVAVNIEDMNVRAFPNAVLVYLIFCLTALITSLLTILVREIQPFPKSG